MFVALSAVTAQSNHTTWLVGLRCTWQLSMLIVDAGVCAMAGAAKPRTPMAAEQRPAVRRGERWEFMAASFPLPRRPVVSTRLLNFAVAGY
jgi:hypothetical protein